MERFINILIVDSDVKTRKGLKEILVGGGNNTLTSQSVEEAIIVMRTKTVGILLVSINDIDAELKALDELKKESKENSTYILIISKESGSGSKLVKGMTKGAVDYIQFPFSPNLIRSKIDVYKALFYKDQRIGQLLENIFPRTILNELSTTGKYSPKRIQNGVVLFTDFVDFSSKAKDSKPLNLLRQLERHFTVFDEIIRKYKLEKIKTIGDAYMALSGITEECPLPAVRTCLAALEIREYMRTERDTAIAMNRDFWEIRIGIHMGPLVAGIIGTSKFSFDVWGDTVNIASRAEAATRRGNITVTRAVVEHIGDYFETRSRGNVEIHKRGGSVEMFYLQKLKNEFCLYNEGKYANSELRANCGLASMDFDHLRKEILNRLKSLLPEDVVYHDVPHTLNVEKAAIRYAQLEGLDEGDILLLRTAVLFHDAGFVKKYDHNEQFGISMAAKILPSYGYSSGQIELISGIIEATQFDVQPRTILEKIMCDADHDYLGRPDYKNISTKLRKEMAVFGREFSDVEWIQFQLDFLRNKHQYHTETAQNIREQGKKNRILELEKELEALNPKT
jgi:adenylate cyclase